MDSICDICYPCSVRISEGVEWALHSTSVLAMLPPGWTLPAGRLAELHELPAPYLAKHLQALARAGILEATSGPRGGYRLARPASEVTMLDVVRAVEGDTPAFRCREIRRQGPCAVGPEHYVNRCAIHAAMADAEAAWRGSLAAVTIAELNARVVPGLHPDTVAKSVDWVRTSANQREE